VNNINGSIARGSNPPSGHRAWAVFLFFVKNKRFFDKVGIVRYIKLPKPGTNPRGVEITRESLASLVQAQKRRLS